jgi:iron complex outermembrane receptor protein
VSGFYKDEIYLGQDPVAWEFKDDATLDDYTVWNARLAFSPHSIEGLELSVYADNLSNEFYYGTGTVNAGNIGASSTVRGKPRNFGVQVYYSW